MRRYVLVSGLPASGKSTLARALAGRLHAACIDKDDLLESLFHAHGPVSVEQRSVLSRVADEQLQERALRTTFAVLVSWWRHPASHQSSGTPTDWLTRDPAADVCEVHCQCAPEIAVRRFASRVRHGGHHDSRWTEGTWLGHFAEPAHLGPLISHPAVVCNTENPLTDAAVDAVADAVGAHFATPKT